MINNVYILNNIELLREKLGHYLLYLEPTDSRVIYVSQELDKYIVLYERSKFLVEDSAW
jgi:hypothetical protein